MKNKNLHGGFAPLLIIAIVAALAIGGGEYVVTKNKVKAPVEGDNLETQANVNADVNANANANLGVNANANAKGSLRSLLGMGKDTMCTFTSNVPGQSSSGTVYVTSSGEMRGDFTTTASGKTQDSSMLVKGGTSYMWSGSQGVKMATPTTNASAVAGTGAKSSVDLDLQVDYKCSDWTRDESKFTVPSTIKFVDLGAVLKLQGGVE